MVDGKSPLERGQIMSVQRMIRGVSDEATELEIETHLSTCKIACGYFFLLFPFREGIYTENVTKEFKSKPTFQ